MFFGPQVTNALSPALVLALCTWFGLWAQQCTIVVSPQHLVHGRKKYICTTKELCTTSMAHEECTVKPVYKDHIKSNTGKMITNSCYYLIQVV